MKFSEIANRLTGISTPLVGCGERSESIWRRPLPSSSWTLRTGWPKSCLPELPIRTMTTAVLPVLLAGNEPLKARSKARRLRRRVEG